MAAFLSTRPSSFLAMTCFSLMAPALAGVYAGGPCGPGAGDCYTNHAGPGCDDVACCETVCDADFECCLVSWDNICVNEALELCGCAGEGNCFEANGTPSCNDNNCCSAVCAEDSYCCDTDWDCVCADAATKLCGHAACPGAGSCLENNGSPGCQDAICCNTVCGVDPECCDFGWDNLCVNRARELCAQTATGDCFTAHTTRGCEDAGCAENVCTLRLAFCCETEWDAGCAAAAFELCEQTNCGGGGDCFTSSALPGCAEVSCCNRVCINDPDCCLFEWDNLCVGEANELCDPCPGDGWCDQPNGSAGCENETCCDAVCAVQPLCCSVEWDAACARAAQDLCGNAACPGDGDCSVSNGSPGCDNEACCNAVCLQDWECCAFGWDNLCSQRAANVCGLRNDEPQNAVRITCGEVIRGSTIGATSDIEANECGADEAPGVWYRAIGGGRDVSAHATAGPAKEPPDIVVFSGACERDLSCVPSENGSGPLYWGTQPGETYFILVLSHGGTEGTFELRMCCEPPCADLSGDAIVDLRDVAHFWNCFTGDQPGYDEQICACADFDGDYRIDWEDLLELQCILGAAAEGRGAVQQRAGANVQSWTIGDASSPLKNDVEPTFQSVNRRELHGK